MANTSQATDFASAPAPAAEYHPGEITEARLADTKTKLREKRKKFDLEQLAFDAQRRASRHARNREHEMWIADRAHAVVTSDETVSLIEGHDRNGLLRVLDQFDQECERYTRPKPAPTRNDEIARCRPSFEKWRYASLEVEGALVLMKEGDLIERVYPDRIMLASGREILRRDCRGATRPVWQSEARFYRDNNLKRLEEIEAEAVALETQEKFERENPRPPFGPFDTLV